MNLENCKPLRTNHISIKNYKGIDSFEMEFPIPRYDDEPDIIVIGGPNGIGKSSIIECCALVLLQIRIGETGDYSFCWNEASERFRHMTVRLPELLVNADSTCSVINAEIEKDTICYKIKLTITDKGIEFENMNLRPSESKPEKSQNSKRADEISSTICRMLGFSREPIIEDLFLYFSSYRYLGFDNPDFMNVQNGSIEKDMWLEQALSLLKSAILREYFSNEDVVEIDRPSIEQDLENKTANEGQSRKHIDKINSLTREFCDGGEISKPKLLQDNKFDIRIKIDSNKPFSIDGLGSGQKEIISTLFLIWYYTNDNIRIVFIDEPELHFNAKWHRKFVREMLNCFGKLSKNQHILTTQSADIMDSVNPLCRVLMQ